MAKAVLLAALLTLALPPAAANQDRPPSVPGIDAPQLARIGPNAVGYRTVMLVNPTQPDFSGVTGASVPLRDRKLVVDIWYPALPGGRHATYAARLWGEPPAPPVAFTVPGIAVMGAQPKGEHLPLVIVSHGYGNAPAAMTWLTENLASKGYVVAAIRHDDPDQYTAAPIVRAGPAFYRPVDIAFVANRLKSLLGNQIDAANVGLIGYSMGGYGVMTAGGATLDPDAPAIDALPGGWFRSIARGGDKAASAIAPGIKAIVAIAPAGGGEKSAWGKPGLANLTAPLLLIAGDADQTVGYQQAARAFFVDAVNSDRYLLTFRQAGHTIGLNPAPPTMRSTLWDQDWFEDAVWRSERVNAINLHFITAFFDWRLRGIDTTDFLDVPVPISDDSRWNAAPGTGWGAFSPGGSGVTLWKGFQRGHARGLELLHMAPQGKTPAP